MRDGLTDDQWKILQTPLGEVRADRTRLQEIIRLYDLRTIDIAAQNRAFVPAPVQFIRHGAVISDDLGTHGILNHADGRRYDSKSEFRKATRRAGCVEIGNEKPKDWQPPKERGVRGDFDVAPALKEALQRHGVK